jgi:hypothetical protein
MFLIPRRNIKSFSFESPEGIKPHANRKSKKQFWFDQKCHTIKGHRQSCMTLTLTLIEGSLVQGCYVGLAVSCNIKSFSCTSIFLFLLRIKKKSYIKFTRVQCSYFSTKWGPIDMVLIPSMNKTGFSIWNRLEVHKA